MAETILLRGARQLLTLHGAPDARRGVELRELSIISDGALLIRNGIIEQVGMSRRVENLAAARGAKLIDATGRIVMPAFVDACANLALAHNATERNNERLRDGVSQTPEAQRVDILEGVRALKLVSKSRLILRAEQISAAMARHGTATVGAVSGYGADDTGELKSLRTAEALDGKPLRVASIFLGANATPEETTENDYLEDVLLPLLATVCRRKAAKIAAVRCGAHAFGDEAARKYLFAARSLGMARGVYSQQFGADDSTRLAVEADALFAAHLEYLAAPDADYLARSRTVALLTPAATFHMGLSRFAPARQLIERGAAVALASGYNPNQCPTHSMPFAMTLACRYLGMTAEEAIVAGTLNAAHALGLGGTTGSLECGKQADLLILNARDYRELPLTPGVNLVHTAMRAGKVLHGPNVC